MSATPTAGQIIILSPQELREQSFWDTPHRPIHGLLFILPLVLLYEAAILAVQLGFGIDTSLVLAYQIMHHAFSRLGAGWLYLPGLAVPVIFLFWHLSTREPWVVRPGAVSLMWAESMLLVVPLYLLNQVTAQHFAGTISLSSSSGAFTASTPAQFLSNLTLSIGAGIYEELVFRLVLLALFSFILADLCALPRFVSTFVGIVMSGLLFSMYHYVGTESYEPATFYFRWMAGIYLGLVFATRGFGIAVGTHAIYDIVAACVAYW